MSRSARRVAILVPRRSDGSQRDRVWAWCRRRWEALHPSWPIVEGHHTDGAFSRSAAINSAARDAEPWDVALVIDADVLLDPAQVRSAVALAARTGRVTWAHRRWRGISATATETLLGADPATVPIPGEDAIEKTNPLSWSCCIAVRRDAWDTIGGFDERFRGWRWEDMAFQALACGLVGHERVEGDVYHLWHPRSPGLGRASRDGRGLTADAVRGARLGRRYMVALRRDHGLADRPELASLEALARDIANLLADDARLAVDAQRLGLPDWSGWWPTLTELRDGAEPPASVAFVVHSGGEPGTWEARRGYLRRALASLSERIHHPAWERRVVFSDWGAERAPELGAIGAPHGFYVVGTPTHVGYTRSMAALWRYLDRRVRAEYVFLAEDDFVIHRSVEVAPMAAVLADHPELVQMALLRAPAYESERQRGGILGYPESAFTEHHDGTGVEWLAHRRFFTCNPMLMRRSLARRPWPTTEHSEAVFGRQLFTDPHVSSAFWGDGSAWITHIGTERAGGDY